MSDYTSRFTSDRRSIEEASWSSAEDWEAGMTENLKVDGGGIVARPPTTNLSQPPATVVENFEQGDLSAYETSSGENFAVTSNQVGNGQWSLEADYVYDPQNHKKIVNTSGLNAYPKKGDTFSFWYRANAEYGDKPRVSFNYIDENNQYMILINQSNGGPKFYEVRIFRIAGGNGSVVCSIGGNGSWKGDADTWYEFEITRKLNDEFELEIKDVKGNVEASGSGVDSSPLPAADGIAFLASGDSAYGKGTTKIWIDNFQIKNRA